MISRHKKAFFKIGVIVMLVTLTSLSTPTEAATFTTKGEVLINKTASVLDSISSFFSSLFPHKAKEQATTSVVAVPVSTYTPPEKKTYSTYTPPPVATEPKETQVQTKTVTNTVYVPQQVFTPSASTGITETELETRLQVFKNSLPQPTTSTTTYITYASQGGGGFYGGVSQSDLQSVQNQITNISNTTTGGGLSSASSSALVSFYNTPSTRITAGTNLQWVGNTLNVCGISGGSGLSTTTLNSLSQVVVGKNNDTSTLGANASAIGVCNTASGYSSTAFGLNNIASSCFSSAFGYYNTALDDTSAAFGNGNTASCLSSAFGSSNCACDSSSAFGLCNSALGYNSSASGYANTASGNYSSTFGYNNTASGCYSSAFGQSNIADNCFVASVGTYNGLCVSWNGSSFSYYGACPSGIGVSLLGVGNTAAGQFASAVGFKNNASEISSSAFGSSNYASGDSSTAFGYGNTASGNFSSAFGHTNNASGIRSSASGYANTASGCYSSTFGYNNTASGCYSSAFGHTNNASGIRSSASGYANTASGNYSSTFGACLSNTTDCSTMLGYGSSYLSVNSDQSVTFSNGASLTAGGTFQNNSDRNLKENFTTLDSQDILNKINSLPVTQWDYKSEGSGVKHIGPMAQDFYTMFNVGNASTSISTIDPAGIALVGIQALSQRLDALAGSSTFASMTFSTSSLTSENSGVLAALQSFGAEVVDGVAYLKEVFVERLSVGSLQIKNQTDVHKTGFTIYDRATGQPICVYFENGVQRTSVGNCDDPAVTNDLVPVSEPQTQPMVTPNFEASTTMEAATTSNDNISTSTPLASPTAPTIESTSASSTNTHTASDTSPVL